MRRPHLVEHRYPIEKPHVVANIAVVKISKVWVHGVVIEVHVGLGVLGFQPCVLRRDGVHGGGRRAFLLALSHRPVVAVIADCANDFFLRDDLEGVLQVLHEPVLPGDWAGIAAGIVLVIVHQDQAIRDLRDGGIVECLVVDRYGDI